MGRNERSVIEDTMKGVGMFQTVSVPILGLIAYMSDFRWTTCPTLSL